MDQTLLNSNFCFESLQYSSDSDIEKLENQWNALAKIPKQSPRSFSRPQEIESPQKLLHQLPSSFEELGKQKIAEGKLGCIFLAAGEGSRLGAELPKALLPITPFAQKSLLQYHLEQIRSYLLKEQILPIILICSSKNVQMIQSYLQKNSFFHLPKELFYFVVQQNFPYLNEKHQPFLSSNNQIACAAYGNGGIFYDLQKAKLLSHFEKMGITHFHVTPIDNPLADPIRPECFGASLHYQCDFVSIVTHTQELHSKSGVYSQDKESFRIIDYPYLSKAEQKRNLIANLNLFTLSLDWIKQLVSQDLPLHLVKKRTQSFLQEVIAWKYEFFITDIVQFAQKAKFFYCPAETVFMPIKVPKDLDKVKKALIKRDQQVLKTLYQIKITTPIELHPKFHHYSKKNLQYLQSHPLTDCYIH